MLKKFLINIVVGSLLIFVLVQFVYRGPNPYEDITFVLGCVMLSAGLLTVSGAARIFRGMGFTLKKLFTRKVDGLSYYEYILSIEDKNEKLRGYPLLFAGITFIILSVTLADKITYFL